MAAYTKDEALTFIEAMRRTLAGKVGFSWFVERLSDLSDYIETITAENEQLRADLESARTGLTDEHTDESAEPLR